jgi:uncharacterized repeat protein (TIGR03987 family)
MLFTAIVAMLLALALYTTGVWGEKRRGRLERRHALLFWCGFVSDATGTFLMFRMAGGGFEPNLHGILGLAAIFLMFLTAAAASFALALGKEKLLSGFHRLALPVWGLWLLSLLSGFFFGRAS